MLSNEKVIQALIYELYYNGLESDDFKDLEQTRAADNEVAKNIAGLNIDMLIADATAEHEKQGFYYGFKCAVELMAGALSNE